MVFDIDLIKNVYEQMDERQRGIKESLGGRPLTLAEKILFSHLYAPETIKDFQRGAEYVDFAPDRVSMQDATAQMALLQFMMAGKDRVAVPTTVHCDHLIQARTGAEPDLQRAKEVNRVVYDFLASVSKRYGIGFWHPGSGIIHQTYIENYAFPGSMMIGTDSHSPNSGGLGMLSIGVGGADAVDVLVGMPWELPFPKLLGVKLTGELSGWSAPKDVICRVAGILGAKGGTGYIIEYFGPGAETISATGKGTICNMGAEVGATTSIFAYDGRMADYLRATGRDEVAQMAEANAMHLRGDPEVYEDPEMYFDRVIEINLSELEPLLNGPLTPDRSWPISQFGKAVKENNFPENFEAACIGSCTNSSYEDISRVASIARQAKQKGLKFRVFFTVTPGSERISKTIERDGFLDLLRGAGATILANACGPCIGQWDRERREGKNTIINSFNRNFAKRNDGNPDTNAFVTSPTIATAMALAGDLQFNPLTDTITNDKGEQIKLDPPEGIEFPPNGFESGFDLYDAPPRDGSEIEVIIPHNNERLAKLEPFPPWDGNDLTGLKLLIKTKGKCTTDHISMAGPWLRFRGHLDNISGNLYTGAYNAFNGETNKVLDQLSGEYSEVPAAARHYKAQGASSIVIGEENLGEGSSREHAAMEPRHLSVMVVLVKSFARIHESNLKKQGILPLTFADPADYDKIREDDEMDILGLTDFAPGKGFTVVLHHSDGTDEEFKALSSLNEKQFEWFKAGSALNLIASKGS